MSTYYVLVFVQLLASLKSRVTSLEDEVTDFNKTIEELRAAGRVEAMEDLMTNLLGELVRATHRTIV
jgi:hypothetical protein